MRISLVVTVKNEAHSASQLIDDVLGQTRQPDQWIVVDGDSTDGTAEYFENVPSCTLLRFPGNIAQGRNRGLAAADGEVFVTTDGGCRLEATWMEQLLAPFGSDAGHVGADFVGGGYRPTVERPFDLTQWALLDQLNFRATRHRSPQFSCRSLAFRRQLWERVPFPEWLDHGEDAWTLDQWTRLGFRGVTTAAPLVTWSMRPDLPSFFRQHYRYMRADGMALMRLPVHGLRVAFYAACFSLATAGLVLAKAQLVLLALAVWWLYLFANALRLAQVLHREQRKRWALPCSIQLPFLLIALDAAKLSGFVVGLFSRASGRHGAARKSAHR